VDSERGRRRFGDHGFGHRRGGGQDRPRGGPAVEAPGKRRRHGDQPREVAGQAGRAQPPVRRGPRRGSGARAGHRGSGRPRRLRPRDRVHRRGPRHQEGAVQGARRHLRREHDPGLQHVDPARHRAGHGDQPAGQGVRGPLLQPGAGHGPRGDRQAADRERRDNRLGQGIRRRLWQDGGGGGRPGRLHREQPAVPLPEQRGAALREPGRHQGGHRRGDEGRVQLPDGPLRPARPGRPRHQPRHPRCALRRVQGPELRRPPLAEAHGGGQPAGPEVGQGLLRLRQEV
ncbi:MAG: 3-hydroxybutyryl-CoA dehydrogenase; 3-hydroxyacyl-CoA dehydrogenase, partial [uncultured Acidimicrobiales bacterium]